MEVGILHKFIFFMCEKCRKWQKIKKVLTKKTDKCYYEFNELLTWYLEECRLEFGKEGAICLKSVNMSFME